MLAAGHLLIGLENWESMKKNYLFLIFNFLIVK